MIQIIIESASIERSNFIKNGENVEKYPEWWFSRRKYEIWTLEYSLWKWKSLDTRVSQMGILFVKKCTTTNSVSSIFHK